MENQLTQLRQVTTIVADTGDFESIQALHPTDATTNPSLILKAIQQPKYEPLLAQTVAEHPNDDIADILDHLLIKFGCKILDVVPGRVSTEVDARLSFNTQATIDRARKLIALYQAQGVSKDRVLIKIASTWEGIQAAKVLEQEGIHCNMTLLFSLSQAIACAQAKVQLISPFVGRIYDWYKKQAGNAWDELANSGIHDPGVKSVTTIFHYYKKHGIKTEIMGASFRNKGQIIALAGCDLLTISPSLLEELSNSHEAFPVVLNASDSDKKGSPALVLDEPSFRFELNQDAMATEKLAEGIRTFVSDAIKLDQLILAHRKV